MTHPDCHSEAREQSEFTYGRHEVSPDGEQIEPTVTMSQKVKLCERGVNPRQARVKARVKRASGKITLLPANVNVAV